MATQKNLRVVRTVLLLIAVCFVSCPVYAKYSGGTGEPNDPYRIAMAEDLMLLGESPEDYDKHFILTADIDLDPYLPGRKVFDKAVIAPHLNPFDSWPFEGASFTGIFNGNGQKISYLTIKGDNYLGLFGRLGPGAIISNLGLEAVDVNGTGMLVGSLVGSNEYGCIIASYSTGNVAGFIRVGGLVGGIGGRFTTSYYNTSVGDFVDESDWGIISSSFWDIQTSGQTTSAGGIGKTTTEMQTGGTFLEAGWDFVDETANGTEDIWWILEGRDYPRLWWEAPN